MNSWLACAAKKYKVSYKVRSSLKKKIKNARKKISFKCNITCHVYSSIANLDTMGFRLLLGFHEVC